jgi:hypothetical protein
MACEGYGSGDYPAHDIDGIAETVTILCRGCRRGRTKRATLSKRQIAAQHADSGFAKYGGRLDQKRRIAVSACPVREDEAPGSWHGGAVQKTPN